MEAGQEMSWVEQIRIHDQKGLSMIEVLASLALLSLMTVSMLAIFCPVAGWIMGARHETTAAYFAAAIIENLRLEQDKIDPLNAGKNAEEIGLNIVCPDNSMVDEISLIQAQSIYPNLYDVTVTVTWAEGSVKRGLSMSSVIRKN